MREMWPNRDPRGTTVTKPSARPLLVRRHQTEAGPMFQHEVPKDLDKLPYDGFYWVQHANPGGKVWAVASNAAVQSLEI